MVDRITPATATREVGIVADDYGIDDNWPVFCEEFKQWVLEDNFPAAARRLKMSASSSCRMSRPYEHMKIRILNGGHAAIAYPAALLDIHFVHEAMEDDTVRGFPRKAGAGRDHPGHSAGAGHRPRCLFQLIEKRLPNPKIGDTIPRLCPGRLQPPAEIHPADDGRPAAARRGCHRPVARVGALVPVLRRNHRQRQGDHVQRRQRRPAACGGGESQGRSTGLPCAFGYLRRGCAIIIVPKAVWHMRYEHFGTRARGQRLQLYLDGKLGE